MTKSDARDLFINLNKLGNKKGVKFAYGVSKNIGLLKSEMEALDKAIEVSPEFKEFDEKRIELVKKFAKKDEKGEPIMKNENEYQIGDQIAFDLEFANLKENNKEVFESRTKQVDEYVALLKSDSDINLFKVSLSSFPEDITVSEMYSLKEITTEDTPSPF